MTRAGPILWFWLVPRWGFNQSGLSCLHCHGDGLSWWFGQFNGPWLFGNTQRVSVDAWNIFLNGIWVAIIDYRYVIVSLYCQVWGLGGQRWWSSGGIFVTGAQLEKGAGFSWNWLLICFLEQYGRSSATPRFFKEVIEHQKLCKFFSDLLEVAVCKCSEAS